MDYFINPYLWMFGAAFGCAKFFSWIFSYVENNVLKKIKIKRKFQKIFFWFFLMTGAFLLTAAAAFKNPFPIQTALIYFLCIFFPLFLLFLYPKLFAIPMTVVLLLLSAVCADLSISWIRADIDVLMGTPLFQGSFSEEDNTKYHFYTSADSGGKNRDLVFGVSESAKYLNVEVEEIHSLPIWFPWWTDNFFRVQKITDNLGNLIWENETTSPVLDNLVDNRWGWVSKKDTLKIALAAPVSVYWRAYRWAVEYPMKAIPLEEETFIREENILEEGESIFSIADDEDKLIFDDERP